MAHADGRGDRDTEPQFHPNGDGDSYLDAVAHEDAVADCIADADKHPCADPHPDADSYTFSHTDVYSQRYAVIDTDAHSQPDAVPHAVTHRHGAAGDGGASNAAAEYSDALG